MFIERLLRHQDIKQASIASIVFCSFWREIIRGRMKVDDLKEPLQVTDMELVELRSIFIEPYKYWTIEERIKHTYMAEDLFRISDQERRIKAPMSKQRFVRLLGNWDKDLE